MENYYGGISCEINEIAEINKLALFIEELGEELKLSPELVFNLNLVLEEAVSNVILYAYPKEEQQEIKKDVVQENAKDAKEYLKQSLKEKDINYDFIMTLFGSFDGDGNTPLYFSNIESLGTSNSA